MYQLGKQRLEVYRLKELPRESGMAVITIPAPSWWCWIKVPYLVTGKVEKWVEGEKRPICVGEVDFYDVDVFCFLKLPDLVLERIRDSIIDLVLTPPPFDLHEVEALPCWWEDDDGCATPPQPNPPFVTDIQSKLAKLPNKWSLATDRLHGLDTVGARLDSTLADMTAIERQLWLNTEATGNVKISEIIYSNT